MNRTIIFKKAKITHYMGACTKKGDGRNKEWYETTDINSQKIHIQSIEQTENGVIFSCDCTQQSLHQPKNVICSHIISVILRKIGEIRIR